MGGFSARRLTEVQFLDVGLQVARTRLLSMRRTPLEEGA